MKKVQHCQHWTHGDMGPNDTIVENIYSENYITSFDVLPHQLRGKENRDYLTTWGEGKQRKLTNQTP